MATLASSEWAQGIFSKILSLNSVHSKEKDEACFGFLVKFFTKYVDRGGVAIALTVLSIIFSCFLPSLFANIMTSTKIMMQKSIMAIDKSQSERRNSTNRNF